MGLDFVKFILSVEVAFDVSISDSEAQRLTTPRRVIEYLRSRLPTANRPVCLSQRTFHRLRTILCKHGFERNRIRRHTNLWLSLPIEARDASWIAIADELGVRTVWPMPVKPSWWSVEDPRRFTVQSILRTLMARTPRSFLATNEMWSRPQIRDAVLSIVHEEFGVDTEGKGFHETMSFAEDMGID